MRYLYQRGPGAKRRVIHLCGYEPLTGSPIMKPICGRSNGLHFNTTSNVSLGRPLCKAVPLLCGCWGVGRDRDAVRFSLCVCTAQPKPAEEK